MPSERQEIFNEENDVVYETMRLMQDAENLEAGDAGGKGAAAAVANNTVAPEDEEEPGSHMAIGEGDDEVF